MYAKLLSIIIPTRNRQIYAEKCIRTILQYDTDEFEIIVQDNSDNDDLREAVSRIHSDRIKYNYTKEPLSFCANFEKAIEFATGDYFIYIGDDDSILPYLLTVTRIAREKGIESIRFTNYISYKWPKATGDNEEGTLVIRDVVPYIRKLETQNAIASMFRKGDFDYQQYNFPFVYHGIIKRELFDKVKEKTGHYFSGLTPDIYSAISLSYQIKEILFINFPLTIPGICPRSGSADGLTGKHNGELKNAPHFRGITEYHWEEEIPYVYSVDTIWAETALKAIKDNGQDPVFTEKTYYRYTVKLCVKNPDSKDRYIDFFMKKFNKTDAVRSRFNLSIKAYKTKYFIKRGILYLKRKLVGRHEFTKVLDIETASEIVIRHYDEKKTFDKVLRLLNQM